MRSALLLGLITALLCFATQTLINQWWVAVPAQVAVASLTTAGWALGRAAGLRRRVADLSAWVVAAYEEGRRYVPLSLLAQALSTPEALEAARRAQKFDEEVLAARYANGDASDY